MVFRQKVRNTVFGNTARVLQQIRGCIQENDYPNASANLGLLCNGDHFYSKGDLNTLLKISVMLEGLAIKPDEGHVLQPPSESRSSFYNQLVYYGADINIIENTRGQLLSKYARKNRIPKNDVKPSSRREPSKIVMGNKGIANSASEFEIK